MYFDWFPCPLFWSTVRYFVWGCIVAFSIPFLRCSYIIRSHFAYGCPILIYGLVSSICYLCFRGLLFTGPSSTFLSWFLSIWSGWSMKCDNCIHHYIIFSESVVARVIWSSFRLPRLLAYSFESSRYVWKY